jgi:ABC-type bacteriocin/lantibiotic exporter with double-glycine peptidase domain
MQNIAANLPHLRAVGNSPYLIRKTDELTRAYAEVRQRRSDLLTGRQYKAAAMWQVVGHAGLIGTAGMLVSIGQLTVGQFAAAELVAGNLLLNMDTLARRMVHMFFAFASSRRDCLSDRRTPESIRPGRHQSDGQKLIFRLCWRSDPL